MIIVVVVVVVVEVAVCHRYGFCVESEAGGGSQNIYIQNLSF